jgi:nucleoside-diphosphate-sugar epimerase
VRVFVTGGSGLLGSHLAALLRAEGHEVVALQRRSSETTYLRDLGCELVEGDVRDEPEDLAAAMRGCTHLVHGAALVYAAGTWPKTRAVNVEGTRHVLEGAAMAGIPRAVHISSVAVYGTRDGRVDETTPLDEDLPASDLYGRSKREAEERARMVEAETGIAVTILRPCAVYGERDRLLGPAIARLVARPVTLVLGRGDNTLPVVYAGNVAVAVLLALRAGRGGATYDVGLDHPLTQRELLLGIARGLGSHPTLVSVPAVVVRAAAAVLRRLGVSAPGTKHLPLAQVVGVALGENPYPSVRIRRDLGWDPPHRHVEALERTGRWVGSHPSMKHHGAEA